MYLTDLTFLDLRRKKNGTLSTPTTPVSKFVDYSRRTPPISNIQAQVNLCVSICTCIEDGFLRLMQFTTPLDIFKIPHMVSTYYKCYPV